MYQIIFDIAILIVLIMHERKLFMLSHIADLITKIITKED